jgi:hypothetical protein
VAAHPRSGAWAANSAARNGREDRVLVSGGGRADVAFPRSGSLSTTTVVLIAVTAAGILLGGFYGVMAAARLVQARRLPPILDSGGSRSPAASHDTPIRRFRGEAFESSWQGSQGYDRPIDSSAQSVSSRPIFTVISGCHGP